MGSLQSPRLLEAEASLSVPEQQHRAARKPIPNATLSEVKSAPDAPLMPHKLPTSGNLRESSLSRTWWFQIVCCIIALATVFGIAFFLYALQHRPSPTLPYQITVNTIVSILVITMKGCILLALADGIGQLKWEHFRKRRPLDHFVAYDSASRGPWGCVELIFAVRGRGLIAILGALTTILTLPIEAFTQQLVSYYPCTVHVTNGSIATIPRASFYTETAGRAGPGLWNPTSSQIGAIVGAVFTPDSVRVPFQCSTGQCDFGSSYATLAFSADCRDVTDELRIFRQASGDVTGVALNSTLPSGLWAKGTVPGPVFSMSARTNETDYNTVTVEMILGAQGLGSESGFDRIYGSFYGSGCDSDWQNQTWGCIGKGAARCTIKPSVKTYNTSIVAGVLHEELLETYSDWYSGTELQRPGYNYSAMADLSCVDNAAKDALKRRGFDISTNRFIPYDVVVSAVAPQDNNDIVGNFSQISNRGASGTERLSSEQLSLVPKTCIYEMPDFARNSIYKFLRPYLNATVTVPLVGMAPTRAGALQGDSQALMILNNTQLDIGSIQRTFDAVAQALTIQMRTWHPTDTIDFNQAETGEAKVSTTCVSIRWPWITYAAATVVLAMVFFILVVIKTETQENSNFAKGWMNSPLPLIQHGIDGIVTDEMDSMQDKDNIKVMAKWAKKSTGYIVRHRSSGQEDKLRSLQE